MCSRASLVDYLGTTLRTMTIDGAPWFVAADACRILGLNMENGTKHHYRKLAADEQRKVSRIHVGMTPGRPVTAISESGLYKLIMRSDKREAREFQNWVTREVLPSIRRTDFAGIKK